MYSQAEIFTSFQNEAGDAASLADIDEVTEWFNIGAAKLELYKKTRVAYSWGTWRRIRIEDIQGFPAATGTYTLTYRGVTTAAIAITETAAQVQAKLEALSNLSVGDVYVTELPIDGLERKDLMIEFTGIWAGWTINSADFTLNTGGLSDASTVVFNSSNQQNLGPLEIRLRHDEVMIERMTYLSGSDELRFSHHGDYLVWEGEHLEAYSPGAAYVWAWSRWPLVTSTDDSEMPLVADAACVYYALHRFHRKLASNRALYKRYSTLLGANAVSMDDLRQQSDDYQRDFEDAKEDLVERGGVTRFWDG